MLELVAKSAGAKIEFRGISLVGIDKPTTLNVTNKPLDKVIGELIGNQNVKVEYDDTHRIIISSYDRLDRSEEHTSELQSRQYLVCRLLLEKKKNKTH